jgi:hypothetical protein
VEASATKPPAGNVAAAAVASDTTKPGPDNDGQGDGVDRDELFDALDDLTTELDHPGLHSELAAALTEPAAHLQTVLGDQDGHGPLDDLTTAARHIIDAITDYRHTPPHHHG